MAIDDRDYMKSRICERRHVRWNDRRSRLEFDEADLIARQFRRRARRLRSAGLGINPNWLITGALALAFAGAAWVVFTRGAGGAEFPASGSVTVAQDLVAGSARARFRIRAGINDAVVQLLRPDGDHVMSIYMRAGDERIVPVPEGLFALRIAEGARWLGTNDFFGPGTVYRRANQKLLFAEGQGHFLQIEARDGNLQMKPEWHGVPRP